MKASVMVERISCLSDNELLDSILFRAFHYGPHGPWVCFVVILRRSLVIFMLLEKAR